MIVKIQTMEKLETIVTMFLIVLSTFAVLLDALPSSTPSTKEKSVTSRPYYGSDPFVRDLPPPSKDEPIGPRDDTEKNNSIRLLDNFNKNASFWRKAASFVPTTVTDKTNTTAESSSVTTTEIMANSSIASVMSGQSSNISSTLAPIEANVTVTTDIVNASFPENQSTIVPSNGTEIPNKTSEMVSSLLPLATTSSPSSTMSSPTTKPPKMPVTTSSSIPMSISPVLNGTVHTKHRKARHPMVFFLLPFLVAGGVAFIIFLGSYLRKKIRLDKLRHQLMPLYSFDPQEGEDWETELLTEPRASGHQPTITTTRTLAASTDPPKLRFAPDTVEV